jgi:phosphoribosylaminoimidazole (AIR) synthetase
MPYIEPEARETLDNWIDCLKLENLSAGELNYIISRLLYIWCKEDNYAIYNAGMGVLECVKQEVYRRVIAKLEDKKRKQNGEVFD